MEEIKDIVQNIVRGCGQGGVQISEILAAFVAKTVVESNASAFALDRPITQDKREDVILQSIERLLERDNPALELIKMQVDFDSTYLQEEQEAQRKLKNRSKMISTHKQSVADVKMDDAQDYEALTSLYRKIFRFLLEFAPNSRPADKVVEREIAAALESVFPRVGLKTFIQLGTEEKMTQLLELARIVLGIRLFNREEGRGGGGIDSLDKDGLLLAKILLQDIEKEMDFFQDACGKYQKAIVRAHLYRRKKLFMEKQLEQERKEADDDSAGGGAAAVGGNSATGKKPRHGVKSNEIFLISQLEDVNDYVIERWSQELSNRRQYLNFLKTLQDEVKFLNTKIESITEKIKLELTTIKTLVSNKASVPKEVVYPRFDALGNLWLTLYEEIVVMIARSNTFQALCKYRLSFSPTLADELFGEEDLNSNFDKSMKNLAEKKANKRIETELERAEKQTDAKIYGEGDDEMELDERDENIFAADAKGGEPSLAELKKFDLKGSAPMAESKNENEIEEYSAAGAQLLTLKNTPDFTLLPLEFQGFCPWTMVEARGLLVPGKPSLGIVRFENAYYVFDHLMGLQTFMKNPEHYLLAIRDRALRNPEFIHLLRLQKWFPTASIAKLLQRHEMEINNQTGQPFTKDAATETPIHFQESYIDLNYHWNEWELRRRALKIVNLKNCKTTSQQTDASHYRRENETQVYLPKTNETQTKRDKGTNPPIVTTYVQGLRGKQLMDERTSTFQSKKEELKAEEKDVVRKKIDYPKVAIVKLTLDL